MHRFYSIITIAFIYLIELILAQHQANDTCPNYSYKCPDCKEGQSCVYPLIHGCERSGLPACQSKNCHGVICAPKALPCPDECPLSCEYHGPPCCPFIGQPTCLPPCQTFVPCKITACPSNCPDDCFYPDADYCCPRSGIPVCRSQLEDMESSQQSNLFKRAELSSNNSTPGNTENDSGNSDFSIKSGPTLGSIDNKNEKPFCIDMIVPCPPECPGDCEYPTDVPCPLTHQPKCRSTVNPDQNGYTWNERDENLETKLNKLLDEYTDIVDGEAHVVSHLEELLLHEQELLEWLNPQRKSPIPTHPTSPPHKASTTTTSTTTVCLPSSKICPMIYVPCPELCPTTCIRPSDVPCPFAVPGYCP